MRITFESEEDFETYAKALITSCITKLRDNDNIADEDNDADTSIIRPHKTAEIYFNFMIHEKEYRQFVNILHEENVTIAIPSDALCYTFYFVIGCTQGTTYCAPLPYLPYNDD